MFTKGPDFLSNWRVSLASRLRLNIPNKPNDLDKDLKLERSLAQQQFHKLGVEIEIKKKRLLSKSLLGQEFDTLSKDIVKLTKKRCKLAQDLQQLNLLIDEAENALSAAAAPPSSSSSSPASSPLSPPSSSSSSSLEPSLAFSSSVLSHPLICAFSESSSDHSNADPIEPNMLPSRNQRDDTDDDASSDVEEEEDDDELLRDDHDESEVPDIDDDDDDDEDDTRSVSDPNEIDLKRHGTSYDDEDDSSTASCNSSSLQSDSDLEKSSSSSSTPFSSSSKKTKRSKSLSSSSSSSSSALGLSTDSGEETPTAQPIRSSTDLPNSNLDDDWVSSMKQAWQDELKKMGKSFTGFNVPLLRAPSFLKTSTTVDEVNEILNNKESTLDLLDQNVSSDDCKRMLEKLSGYKGLTCLMINAAKIRTEGAMALASLLGTLENLESFTLNNSAVATYDSAPADADDIGIFGVRALSGAISEMKSLTSLDFSNLKLTDDSMSVISSLLANTSSLQHLDLSNNRLISNNGLKTLSEGLSKNNSILSLKLNAKMKLTTEGVLSLFEAFRTNRTLQQLEIRTKNAYSVKQLQRITDFAKLSGAVRVIKLIVGNEEVSDRDRRALDAVLKENNDCHLRPVAELKNVQGSFGEINRLNISQCQLTDLEPKDDWTSLTELIAADNRITSIPPSISRLRHLTMLNLSSNSISTVPDELGDLDSLEFLDLGHNQLSSLPLHLSKLRHLITLKLDHNRFSTFPSVILHLQKLTYLNLSFNQLTGMPELSSFTFPSTSPSSSGHSTLSSSSGPALLNSQSTVQLSGNMSFGRLEVLYLEHNKIKSLPASIGNLKKLRVVGVNSNQLMFLPLEICQCKQLERIELDDNPLPTMPASVIQEGTRAILGYLDELERGSEMFSVVKMMVVGPNNVGKTTLINNISKEFSVSLANKVLKVSKQLSTPRPKSKKLESDSQCYIDIKDCTLDNVTLRCWDFCGDESLVYPLHQFFITQQTVYVITFDVREEDLSKVDPWIQSIGYHAKTSPVLVVATHVDSGPLRDRAIELIQRLIEKYESRFPNICAYVPLSFKSRRGVKELRSKLLEVVQKSGMVAQRLPSTYLLLMKQLELKRDAFKANEQPVFLEWSDFTATAASLSVSPENLSEVVHFLNKSGSIMFYENDAFLKQYIFLDPQWMLDLFCSIVSHKELIEYGILEFSKLDYIWRPPVFPQKLQPLFLSLLKKFDICFQVKSQFDQLIVIPSLLPKQRPQMAKWVPFDDSVLFELRRTFEFNFLPVSFFPRLVQRTSKLKLVELRCVWDKGMVVHLGDDNKAIFEFNPTSFTLKLQIRSNDPKNPLKNLLLDNINSMMQQPEFRNQIKQVLLPCIHCIKEHSFDPFLFSLTDCELTAARGKHYALCRGIRPVRIDLLAPDVAMADVEHLNMDMLERAEALGEGSFAVVYKGQYKDQDVAIKIIKMDEDSSGSADLATGFGMKQSDDQTLRERFSEFRREVSLMSGLYHPNLVELVGLCVDSSSMWMVTEFMAYGDLYTFLQNTAKYEMCWNLRIKIALDVARGMAFLHTTTPCIIHRDLKSPNILLRSDNWIDRVVAKVADFGLSSTLVDTISGRDVFNPKWLAPEVMIKGAQYTEKADIYSYGIILWELLTRKTPFEEYDFPFESQLEDAIIKDSLRPTIPADCPEQYANLIKSCWDGDPKRRPTFLEILTKIKEMSQVIAPNLRCTDNVSGGDLTQVSRAPSRPPSTNSSSSSSSSSPSLLPGEELPNSKAFVINHFSLNQKHRGSVKSMLAIGNQVWVGCGDGSLSVWSVNTKQMIYEMKPSRSDGPTAINALCHADGLIWTAAQDSSVSIWNVRTVKLVKTIKGYVYGSLLLVDSNVWCGTTDNIIIIRKKTNYRTKKQIQLEAPTECMLQVNDQVWVATFQAIHVFDSKEFNKIGTLTGHSSMVHCLILVNGKVWSCSSDKTIRIWSLDGQCLQTLEGHASRVFYLLYHDKYVWSCSWDKSIILWDAETGNFVQEIRDTHDDAISAMVSINVGTHSEVWSGSWDKTICALELIKPEESHPVPLFLTTPSISEENPVASSSTPSKRSPRKDRSPSRTLESGPSLAKIGTHTSMDSIEELEIALDEDPTEGEGGSAGLKPKRIGEISSRSKRRAFSLDSEAAVSVKKLKKDKKRVSILEKTIIKPKKKKEKEKEKEKEVQ